MWNTCNFVVVWIFFGIAFLWDVCVCVYASMHTVSLLSLVQLFATLWTIALQSPLSMGILQVGIQEWIAMPSSRGSSWPRNWDHISYICRQVLYHQHHLGSPIYIIYQYTCTNIYIFFFIFYYGLFQDIEYNSLCYTVRPYYLFYLFIQNFLLYRSMVD